MRRPSPKIAFVDDEAMVLQSLRRALGRAGKPWEASFFTNPEEALAESVKTPFDVLVSDMRMPQMSGLELVDAVRRESNTACIILTGSPDLSSALYAINEAQIFRYYTKPCDTDLLFEGVDTALALKSAPAAATNADTAGLEDISREIGLAALNRLAVGVIVLDGTGRISFVNNSAGALLAKSDGLVMAHGEMCRASTPEETQNLMTLVKNALSPLNDPASDTFAMAVSRPSLLRPLSVFATPLFTGGAAGRENLVALFVSDPETRPIPSEDQIARLYGLSKSEAAIARALAKGANVEDAAQAASVTVSTARTYLKQIFSKTDTNRQSELMKLIIAAPAVSAP